MRADLKIREASGLLGDPVLDGKERLLVVLAGLTVDVGEQVRVESRDALADHGRTLSHALTNPGSVTAHPVPDTRL